MVRFKEFYNDGESALLIGTCQTTGEFAWYPVIKWEDVSDYRDFDFSYIVSLRAVAPSLVPAEEWARAAGCMGLEDEEGEHIDSCGGFIGSDFMRDTIRETMSYYPGIYTFTGDAAELADAL